MEVHPRTVDLCAYPDLVMIYLGMQVHSLRGLKTFSASLLKSPNPPPIAHKACSVTKGLFGSCFRCTLGYASIGAILTVWNAGPDPNPTRSGGEIFCAIPVVPASGTRLISCAAAWKPSMTM